jgi:hypothetical protein
MLATVLVIAATLAAEPTALGAVGTLKRSADEAYRAARAKAGRDAESHVGLALWCEAKGLASERLEQLTIAVLTDPAHATARGLLGSVAFRGQWRSPELIGEQLQADLPHQRVLDEYRSRRARMGGSAGAHWKMALWCREHGLDAEAAAHLTVVTQLDPGHEAAWKRLHYKKHGGRWLTDEQVAAEQAEAAAQGAADKSWTTRLENWRSGLEDKSKRGESADALRAVTDPRAVPSVWAIFAIGDESRQNVFVHDSSLVETIVRPFDAVPELATLAPGS